MTNANLKLCTSVALKSKRFKLISKLQKRTCSKSGIVEKVFKYVHFKVHCSTKCNNLKWKSIEQRLVLRYRNRI